MLRPLACVIAALAALVGAAAVAFNVLALGRGEESSLDGLATVAFLAAILVPAAVGLFVALRQPEQPDRLDPAARPAVGGDRDGGQRARRPDAARRPRLDDRRLGRAGRLPVAGAVPVAARARLPVPRRAAAVAPLAPVRRVRLRGVRRAARHAPVRPRHRDPPRRRGQPAAVHVAAVARAGVLGLLGRPPRVDVRRRVRPVRPLPQRRPPAAAAGAVAGLRRAARADLARGRLAADGGHRAREPGRLPRHPHHPDLARRRGLDRGHAARAVLDRPPAQPHARLRRPDGAAGRDLRARLARRRPGGRRVGGDGGDRDAGRRAGLPPAARPRPAPRRPPVRAGAVRRGAAAARLPRRGPRRPCRARGRGGGRGARARRPARRGRLPPARDRRLRGPARPPARGAARRRPRARGHRPRRPRARDAAARPGARAAARPAARA